MPSVSPVSAIQKVANEFELGITDNMQQQELDANQYRFSGSGISSQDIPVELVYVEKGEELILAWDMIIYAKNNWWSARIDASTNEILEYQDLILSCTFEHDHEHDEHENGINFNNILTAPRTFLVDGSSYNVFPLPVESPNHGGRQIVTEPASISASPFGWHDDNGIAGADYTITRGNNVWAKEDFTGDNSDFGFAPDGTSALNFNFTLDFSTSPLDYQNAAITNLFYLNNMMHDIWFCLLYTSPSPRDA